MEGPVPIVDQEVDGRDAWLDARKPGVTATEVAALVGGGAGTRRRILNEKEGESAFGGNAATRRGVRREPYIADWVTRRFGIIPNRALWAQEPGSSWLATPDGLGWNYGPDQITVGAEIKSTTEDWSKGIPRKYLDQMLWCMFVLGASRWLFVWEQCDEDGQPLSLEPQWVWVERDEIRIAKLLRAAEKFVAWREAGAPNLDADLPEEIDDALSAWADAKAIADEAAKDLKAADDTIRAYLASHPTAAVDGLTLSGSDAGFVYTAPPMKFAPEKWAKRAPRQFATYKAAQEKYREPGTPRLTIKAHK